MSTKHLYISLLLALITITSCTRYKKLIYIDNPDFTVSNSLYNDYKLKCGDALYIRILSSDDRINALYRPVGEGIGVSLNENSLYIASYVISSDSSITLPVVGRIKAADYTVTEFETMLQKEVNQTVNEAYVSVKLVNYKVTLLGEVLRPGIYQVYQPNTTIFDIIAKAGDIPSSGNRNDIIVIREHNNKITKYKIDLGSVEALKSPVYHLYPNDVVIVKPLKYKVLREDVPIFSLLLSAITTFILVLRVVQK